jgi:DNA-binding transcriptional regulator YhcF (GntR family)
MLNAGGNKVIGKSSQRKGKTERQGRKAETRKQAGEQQGLEAEPKPDQLQHAAEQIHAEEQIVEQINEQISAPVASMEISPPGPSVTDIVPTVPAVSAEPVAVSVATIANAYGAYTGKSVELTWSFLEKLAAARSLDKAFEVQTEFAKRAFETFFAESRKIHELHSELARQRGVYLDGFVARMTQTTFVLHATRH